MKMSPLLPPLGVFTGGGTGGHVFPGLAVWEKIRAWWPGDLLWIGASDGMEKGLVTARGLAFKGIASGKLRRYFSPKNLTDPFRILWGFLKTLLFFLRRRPAFVFSKGGFVSVPPVWAAGFLGVPIFSHESDLHCGLATRLNLGWSKKVFVGYERTLHRMPRRVRARTLVTGNPVRCEILAGSRHRAEERWGWKEDKPLVLVLGGSSGALQINLLVPDLVSGLLGRTYVLHQTGKNWCPPPRLENYQTAPFLGPEIADALARADILVSRSGAGSLWEAAAWKLPMVLIPLEAGSRGDQLQNALYWESLDCAVVLRNPRAALLTETVAGLLADPSRLAAMREAFPEAGPSVAEVISNEVKSYLGSDPILD